MVTFLSVLVALSAAPLLVGGDSAEDVGCYLEPEEVDCVGLDLVEVPSGLPVGVVDMYLEENSITSLKATDFAGLADLAELSLLLNVITEIAPGTFRDNVALAYLDLEENDMRGVSTGLWGVPASLEYLYLGYNFNLISVEPGAWATSAPGGGLVRLGYLDMPESPSSCEIVGSGAIECVCSATHGYGHIDGDPSTCGLVTTTTITATSTTATATSTTATVSTTTVTTLEPEGPALGETDCEVKVRSSGIEISCEDVGLTQIPTGFPGGTRVIFFEENQITSIRASAFSGLSELTELWFYDNSITEIATSAFSACKKLTIVDLELNNIKTLPPGLWGMPVTMENLYLGRNTKLREILPLAWYADGDITTPIQFSYVDMYEDVPSSCESWGVGDMRCDCAPNYAHVSGDLGTCYAGVTTTTTTVTATTTTVTTVPTTTVSSTTRTTTSASTTTRTGTTTTTMTGTTITTATSTTATGTTATTETITSTSATHTSTTATATSTTVTATSTTATQSSTTATITSTTATVTSTTATDTSTTETASSTTGTETSTTGTATSTTATVTSTSATDTSTTETVTSTSATGTSTTATATSTSATETSTTVSFTSTSATDTSSTATHSSTTATLTSTTATATSTSATGTSTTVSFTSTSATDTSSTATHSSTTATLTSTTATATSTSVTGTSTTETGTSTTETDTSTTATETSTSGTETSTSVTGTSTTATATTATATSVSTTTATETSTTATVSSATVTAANPESTPAAPLPAASSSGDRTASGSMGMVGALVGVALIIILGVPLMHYYKKSQRANRRLHPADMAHMTQEVNKLMVSQSPTDHTDTSWKNQPVSSDFFADELKSTTVTLQNGGPPPPPPHLPGQANTIEPDYDYSQTPDPKLGTTVELETYVLPPVHVPVSPQYQSSEGDRRRDMSVPSTPGGARRLSVSTSMMPTSPMSPGNVSLTRTASGALVSQQEMEARARHLRITSQKLKDTGGSTSASRERLQPIDQGGSRNAKATFKRPMAMGASSSSLLSAPSTSGDGWGGRSTTGRASPKISRRGSLIDSSHAAWQTQVLDDLHVEDRIA